MNHDLFFWRKYSLQLCFQFYKYVKKSSKTVIEKIQSFYKNWYEARAKKNSISKTVIKSIIFRKF